MVRALSSRSRGNRAAIGVVLVFALVAGGFAYGLVVKPAVSVVRARGWQMDACDVLSSAVRRLARNAYDLDLSYEWHRGGGSFRGSRFDFFGSAFQDPREWAPVLDRLRPGQSVTCYVDPARPEHAVIDRGWKGGVGVPAVVLFVFLLTLFGLRYVTAPERGTMALIGDRSSRIAAGPAGPVPLRPRTTPRRRLRRASLLAVLLSATAALVFVAIVLPGWREGRPSWFLMLFVGVFALAGLAQVARVARALAALAGPTVVVTAVPEARLGERLVVQWRVETRPDMVTGLDLALVGREIARYPDWDANQQQVESEEKTEFFRVALATGRAGNSWAAGNADIDVPRLLPPSFAASSNEIAWAIVLRASVRRLPDLEEEYPIRLRPPRQASR